MEVVTEGVATVGVMAVIFLQQILLMDSSLQAF